MSKWISNIIDYILFKLGRHYYEIPNKHFSKALYNYLKMYFISYINKRNIRAFILVEEWSTVAKVYITIINNNDCYLFLEQRKDLLRDYIVFYLNRLADTNPFYYKNTKKIKIYLSERNSITSTEMPEIHDEGFDPFR